MVIIVPRECPNCDKALTRTRRQPWMNRIPGSKYYVCKGCDNAYLLVFDRWLLQVEAVSPESKWFQRVLSPSSSDDFVLDHIRPGVLASKGVPWHHSPPPCEAI